MESSKWSRDEAHAFLCGMKSVATVRGSQPLVPIASEMLVAVRVHVLHREVELETLVEMSPHELADKIQGRQRRHEFIQFLILMPYLPMQVDASQVAVVEEVAKEFGVEGKTLEDLRRVRDERLKRLALDFGRRELAGFANADGIAQELRAVGRSLHQFVGDAKVAKRYQALEKLPEGSLGRTLFRLYRDRGFPLPGEKKSFSEFTVSHDCCHILGGFNTDMNGEMNVAGFEAALFDGDFGFELLLEVILDFHMGKAFTTAGLLPPGSGHFDPEDVLRGYELGVACKVNLLQGWDFWEFAEEQVTDLRAHYGLPEIPGPIPLPPPEAMQAPPPH